MTDEDKAFLAAIAESPAERLHQFVYADWLDENDRHAEAHLRRNPPVGRLREFVDVQRTYDGRIIERPVGQELEFEAHGVPTPEHGELLGRPWLKLLLLRHPDRDFPDLVCTAHVRRWNGVRGGTATLSGIGAEWVFLGEEWPSRRV